MPAMQYSVKCADHRTAVDEEERGDRPGVETDHRQRRDDIQPF
jgi:hypothetical protein